MKKQNNNNTKWIFIILIFFVLICYANSISNGFVSDDRSIIALVPSWNLQSVFSPLYGFLRNIFYFIPFKLGGLNPSIFRSINILFHIGSVLLVYKIFSILGNKKIGFMTALFFAVHPVITESITWISAGVYPQFSFFFLASFYTYLLSLKDKRFYLVSLAFFVLCLMTSEKAIGLCLVYPLYTVSFRNIRTEWKKTLIFVLLSLLWTLFYFWKLGERHDILLQEQGESGFNNPLYVILVSLTSYLELIFWPDKLTLYHSELSFSYLSLILRTVIFFGFFGIIIYSYRKVKLIFFSLTFFVIVLMESIVSSAFGLSWIVAERYAYLAIIGLVVPVAWVFDRLIRSVEYRKWAISIFVILIFALMMRTIFRNMDWADEDHLWLSAARTSPSSAQNHNNLGDYYGRHKDLVNAVNEFQTAIVLKPGYADAYHNLGNAYRDMGKSDEAIMQYQKALSFKPGLWQSYQNIATIYYQEKKFEDAKVYIEKGVLVDPHNANLRLIQGLIYVKLHEFEKATSLLLQILKIDPENQLAQQGIGEIQMYNNMKGKQ